MFLTQMDLMLGKEGPRDERLVACLTARKMNPAAVYCRTRHCKATAEHPLR
jgi:hypothetical protein